MGNGYKILWSDNALRELADTYNYLETYFTDRELKVLSTEIQKTLKLVAQNPKLFPLSEFKGVRRVVVQKFNTMYYREMNTTIEIISFFSNRQNPDDRNLKT